MTISASGTARNIRQMLSSWWNGKGIRRAFRYLLLIVAGVILLSLFFRNSILSYYIHRRVEAFNRRYDAVLAVGDARIRWLSSVRLTGISLRPEEGDTLVRIDTLTARLNFIRMVFGRVDLSDVELKNTRITFIRQDTATNYMFLPDHRARRDSAGAAMGGTDYAGRISGIFDALFDKVPDRLLITRFSVSALTDGHHVGMKVDTLAISDRTFRFAVKVDEEKSVEEWIVAGILDKGDRRVEAAVYAAAPGKVTVPYIRYRWNAGLSFDTLFFSLSAGSGPDGISVTEGTASVKGLIADHPRIAAQPVSFRAMGASFRINAGRDYLELDSTTSVTFNRLTFNPYIRYQKDTSKQITLRLRKDWFPARDLFSSLPEGLFTAVTGMQVTGELAYDMHLFVDLSAPDSLVFDSELRRRGFRILSYGAANLSKLDSSFEYTAYDGDLPLRTFTVGPENPMFRPLGLIPPLLRYSVLTAEDGGFYQHRGFLMDAIRESIATDIKERRFARGGSTITMQLVKNVFLSRNKTIARKLEEMLIVWLIENQQLCTKDRMLEVYLNIIEWGPMVYGANEAARFYFARDVNKLSYAESVFLASIIPKPKWFRSSFDSAGHLRPDMADYYRLVSQKMLSKGWASPSDVAGLVPDVELRGPAREMLRKADTAGTFRPRLIRPAGR